MALKIYDTMKPQGSYPAVEAADVMMPDGSRLDEISISYPIVTDGATDLAPDVYHVFGEVTELTVTLAETNDGKLHEYCFEFIPTEGFTELTITPEPRWANDPQFPAGKTCQVSIVRGIGVSVNA